MACAVATAAPPSRSGCRTSVRAVSGRSRSTTTTRSSEPRSPARRSPARAPGIWRYAELLPVDAPPTRGLPVGSTPLLAADRLAAGPRARPALDQGRHAQPVAELQGPRGRRGGGPGGRLRGRGPGLRLDRQPGRRHRRRRGRPRAAGVRVHPGRPRAGQDRSRAGLRRDRRPDRRHLRRRQPALSRGRRRDRLGLRQHQPAAVLRRGLQDARVRDRRVARLALAGRRSSRRSRRGRCSPGSRAASRSWSSSASSPAARSGSSAARPPAARPVATAWAAGTDVIEPVRTPDTIVRSLAIGNPADGRYAVGLANDTGGSIEAIEDTVTAEAIRDVARLEGIYPETAGGVTLAAAAAARRRGVIRRRRRGRGAAHRERPQDARRPLARARRWGRPTRPARARSGHPTQPVRLRALARGGRVVSTVRIPPTLRTATGGEKRVDGRWSDRPRAS